MVSIGREDHTGGDGSRGSLEVIAQSYNKDLDFEPFSCHLGGDYQPFPNLTWCVDGVRPTASTPSMGRKVILRVSRENKGVDFKATFHHDDVPDREPNEVE